MKLKNLLYKVKILKIIGSIDSEISDIQFDSRKIQSKRVEKSERDEKRQKVDA